MAGKDLSQKVLLEFPDVFADVFNTLIFQGDRIIKPEELRQITVENISTPGNMGYKQFFRDVVMENSVTGVRYLILGVENQSSPDRMMPLRGMGMDYAVYEKQVRQLVSARGKKRHGSRKRKLKRSNAAIIHRQRKDMKLIPVVTLVLYYGQRDWSGPLCLHDMMQMPDEINYPGIRKYIHNYGMNLVVLKDLNQEESCFISDFRYLAEYLRSKNTDCLKKQFQEECGELAHPEATMMAMAAMTRDERYVGWAEQKEENNGMCKLLDYVDEQGMARGKKLQVIEMTMKKFRRNLTVNQIAEQLEEEVNDIAVICSAMEELMKEGSTEFTARMVYDRLESD